MLSPCQGFPAQWGDGGGVGVGLPFEPGTAACTRGVPSRLPPCRLSPKHRDDGRKTGSQRSSGSRSPSPSGGSGWGSPQQNGGSRQRSGAHGGRPGSAHSSLDVRTLGFAEGCRAARAAPSWVGAELGRGGAGSGRVAAGQGPVSASRGRGRPLPPPRRPSLHPSGQECWCQGEGLLNP